MGPVELAVSTALRENDVLRTPSQGQPFVVDTIDDRGVVLLFGEKRTKTPFSWSTLEGVRVEFMGLGWIPIGGRRDSQGNPGTLDGYLKTAMKRDTAGWVASLLEAAGILEIDRGRPAKIRIKA